MGAAMAERTVVRPNPKGDEADPIFETELYDVDTGERIPKGWKREHCQTRFADCLRDDRDRPMAISDEFTIPGPEYSCVGLQPQYARGRRGRYVIPGQLDGRVW